MPGRQSTGPRPLLKSRPPQRRKRKRGIDAFAIADEEAQQSAKVRKSRLGHLEGGDSPDRDASGDGDSDAAQENGRRPKRSRADNEDEGGDSEGNEWVTGHVPSDDDSSLNSDEAMGSSDEERFEGFAFRGSSSKKVKEKRRKKDVNGDDDIDLDEEDSSAPSDAESEGYNNAAIDPAAVLDQRDSESESDGSEEKARPNHRPPVSLETRDWDQDADDVSQLSFSEEEDDDEDSATKALSGLQSFVTTLGDSEKGHKGGRSAPEFHEAMVPTDFGITSKKKLSITDMLDTVTDPKARKSLRSLTSDAKPSGRTSGVPQKLAVPLPKRQQDRVDRSVAYDTSKETLERWVETVKHNRRAEHLEFPLYDPAAAAAKNNAHLASEPSTKPITALESTIQRIMEESGIDPARGKPADDQIQEFEELKANTMPIEEVRARRAQLRKARELLFREEVKAKRIKKIKSKSWRKVHRKERERNELREKEMLAEAGIEPDEDDEERMHRQRAEERMGGRHRASRWAKGVKKTGRAAWDEEARAGIHEMARREEELKKRMQGQDVDGSSAGESGSESDDEASSDEDDEGRGSRRLLNKLDALQRPSESTNGLHSLKFMQKAEAAKKARNDEDIERLRRELAGEESPSEASAEDEPSGRRRFGPVTRAEPDAIEQPEARNEFEERDEPEGLDVEFTGRKEAVDSNKRAATKRTQSDARPAKQSPLDREQAHAKEDTSIQANENPWMTVTKKSRSKHAMAANADIQISTTAELPASQKPSQAAKPHSTKSAPPKPAAGAIEPIPADADATSDSGSDSGSDSASNSEPATPALTNQALIRQAFAADDVLAEEFAKEKAALASAEAAASEDDAEPAQLPGWGTWVGEGVGKSKQRKQTNAVSIKSLAKGKPHPNNRVIVSAKTQKPNATYLATQLPHPFETRAQYERSLRLPVGPEWQTHATFTANTKPRVKVRAGEVIRPMRKPLM